MFSSTRGLTPRARRLRWIARGLFAGGAAALIVVLWPGRGKSAPPTPPRESAARRTDWARISWAGWEDPQYGVALEYPSIWRPDRMFDEFLRQPLADLKRAPIVGFREATPVVIYRYTAPAPLDPAAWLSKVDATPELQQEFGSQITGQKAIRVSGRSAREFEGIGATRGALWNYESLFFGEGTEAYRITAGADQRDWPVMAPVFRRLLGSVRFAPPVRK